MAKKLQIVSGRPFQADWNITDEDNMAFIRNKPILSDIVKMENITLYSSSWSDEAPHSQRITVNATPNSKIDIQPDVNMANLLASENIRLLIKNDNGIVTAYAINKKPTMDLNLQATIIEVIKKNELDVVWGNII